jgi:gluconokinase
MNYYLGIDIGTTATKTVAFSNEGAVLASVAQGYAMQHPQPGFSEQNPDEIVQAVVQGIYEVTQQLPGGKPLLVAVSAAMHSLIAVDEQGVPITPCIIWADNRSASIAHQLRNSENGKTFYSLTGVPIHSMTPLCKLLWFKEQQPELFEKAYKFIGIKEYLFFKLFGQYVIDTSLATATGLLNIHSLQWEESILKFIGIDAERLSTIVPTVQVYPYQNGPVKLAVPPGTPFVIGASDGALSNIGTGATGPGQMVVNIGTSSAARILLPIVETDEQMRTFCYHANGSQYIAGGASNNGAVVLQWVKDSLLQTDDDFETLFKQATEVVPGGDGLIMLPYILGERAPIWNAHASGGFWGLTVQHTKAHLLRAAMEGVVFAVYSIGKIVAARHPLQCIYATGGFSKSGLWLQMLADVFGVQVLVSDAVESTALGAVMIGAEALGQPLHMAQKPATTYQPNWASHAVYQQGVARYERLYEALKGEMNA